MLFVLGVGQSAYYFREIMTSTADWFVNGNKQILDGKGGYLMIACSHSADIVLRPLLFPPPKMFIIVYVQFWERTRISHLVHLDTK